MKDMVVVTPSYAPDAELCSDLVDSVQQMTSGDVEHHIIVPRTDRHLFSRLAGPRTHIRYADEFLPREWMKIPRRSMWLNAARPWPPIRGWVAQQVVKLACAASFDTQGVLLVDSDMVLVRPISLDTFMSNGQVALYRRRGAIHHGLPRHRLWHESARSLLGLDPPGAEDLTDYVCWPCMWEPRHVRGVLGHIERVTGRAWTTVVGSQIHFSEMMLYGIYLDEVVDDGHKTTADMRSIVHTEERQLTISELQTLLAAGPDDAIAVMISAKSGIPLEVRRKALLASSRAPDCQQDGSTA